MGVWGINRTDGTKGFGGRKPTGRREGNKPDPVAFLRGRCPVVSEFGGRLEQKPEDQKKGEERIPMLGRSSDLNTEGKRGGRDLDASMFCITQTEGERFTSKIAQKS